MTNTKHSDHNNTAVMPIVMLSTLALLCGCAQHRSNELTQGNIQFYGTPGHQGDTVIHEQPPTPLLPASIDCQQYLNTGAGVNYRIDKPLVTHNDIADKRIDPVLAQGLLLSPGDLLEINIENGEGFNGRYIVDNAGKVKLPIIGNIIAAGDTTNMLETAIELALFRQEVFQPTSAIVTIQVLNWAQIEVSVTGAVFQPGRVLINKQNPKTTQVERIDAFGDFS